MKKIIFFVLLSTYLLFSATTEQINQYLSLSHSEQQVIAIEQVFDSMRERQKTKENNESTSQVSIVYQEYLEEHLSSDEIEKVLALYRQPTMSRYTSEIKNFSINEEDMNAFLESLKEEPLLTEREEIVDDIIEVLINEKLQLNFYRSMMQRYQKENEESNRSKITSREKSYINAMKKSAKKELLYGTQVFSMEEMKELKESIGSSIFQKVKKVENEALVKIMNNYIQGIISKPKKRK